MTKGNVNVLSIKDTNVLKGVAILLLLCHHLFYIQNGLYNDIQIYKNLYLVKEIGMFCKVCVVFFVFLSGYGLMAQTLIKGGLGRLTDWYKRRFKKLMLNYWVILLIFVPISYYCFNMTFAEAYHDNIGLHLLTDIIGLHSLFFIESSCYNPTWWFYSCIIVLYLLFPLMYKMIKKDPLMLILLTLIVSFLPIPFIDVIKFNIVAFSLGMWMATERNTPPQAEPMDRIIASLAVCGGEKYQQLSIDDRLRISLAYSDVISKGQMP